MKNSLSLSIILIFVVFLPFHLEAKEISIDPNKIVFISDTHITPKSPEHLRRFIQVCDEVAAMTPRPAFVIIMGDLITNGKLEEYKEFQKIVQKLDNEKIPWNIVIGNHDRRELIFKAFPEKKSTIPEIPGKQILKLETEKVRILLFDSRMDDSRSWMAEKTKYPKRRPWDGTMDEKSKKWLKSELDQSDKPVIVGAHHSAQETKLTEIMKDYPQARVYVHGHSHQCYSKVVDGIDSVSFPSLADNRPSDSDVIGYFVMTVKENKIIFTLQTLDKTDNRNGSEIIVPLVKNKYTDSIIKFPL